MIIQAPDREFEVIQKIREEDSSCVYVGVDPSDSQMERLYLVSVFHDFTLLKEILPVFISLRQNKAFADFVCCFSKEGTLYVVFRYYQEQQMDTVIKRQEIPFIHRLEIMKSLMEKMLVSQLPDALLFEVLRPENLLLSPSLEPQFQYWFDHAVQLSQWTITDVNCRLEEIARMLFDKEFQKRSVSYLEHFFQEVAGGAYPSCKEVYKAYSDLVRKLEELDQQNMLESFSAWKRLGIALQGIWPQLRVILSLLVILGALLVLLFYPISSEKKGVAFTSIGTMEIKK